MINCWRKEKLGIGKSSVFNPLSRGPGNSFLQLCMSSPALVPYPDDPKENIQTTGYWFLEEGREWQPDAALSDFLKAGDKPVYIGFGSMPSQDPETLTQEIVKGVCLANVRAILAFGWGGLKKVKLPETVFGIHSAPHDALFKQVRAVVHHGGAGTTAAGLRAGLPTLIYYAIFDQPCWGRRIQTLGWAPKPRSLKRLTAKQFARDLIELTQKASYRTQADEIARIIGKEDGIMTAVKLIEARHEAFEKV